MHIKVSTMKVKTALFSELRGSIKQQAFDTKPTCRTRKDGVIILQHKPVPTDARTPGQDEIRLAYRACADAWNALSEGDKTDYGVDAALLNLTGYNLFMRSCLLLPPLTLYERYPEHSDWVSSFKDDTWLAQTFTIGNTGTNENHYIAALKLMMYRIGEPGLINAAITAVDGAGKPTGSDLSTGTLDGDTLTTSTTGDVYRIALTTYELQASTQYALIVKALYGDGANQPYMFFDVTSPSYTGGSFVRSLDGGASWTVLTGADAWFKEYGREL